MFSDRGVSTLWGNYCWAKVLSLPPSHGNRDLQVLGWNTIKLAELSLSVSWYFFLVIHWTSFSSPFLRWLAQEEKSGQGHRGQSQVPSFWFRPQIFFFLQRCFELLMFPLVFVLLCYSFLTARLDTYLPHVGVLHQFLGTECHYLWHKCTKCGIHRNPYTRNEQKTSHFPHLCVQKSEMWTKLQSFGVQQCDCGVQMCDARFFCCNVSEHGKRNALVVRLICEADSCLF